MIRSLEVEGLSLERGGRRLFEGLSFRLDAGQALAVTGPNGAGKTSLLRAVAGLLRPAEGAVTFTGADGPLDAGLARSGGLHWLGAQDGLQGGRSAEAELRFWSAWAQGSEVAPGRAGSAPAGDAVPAALARLGLTEQARTPVRRLSTGQRRRLALARLTAQPRTLWLLDEPLAPLDVIWRGRMGGLMAEHLAAGGLLVAAIHDPLPITARELRLEAAG